MATFKAQIEDLAGTIPATVDAEQFLKDGVWDIIHRIEQINPPMLHLFASQGKWPDSAGYALSNNIVLDVARDSIPCRHIPLRLADKASDVDSIYLATTNDPVWYIQYGVLQAIPVPTESAQAVASIVDGGTVTNWDTGTSSITSFPSSMYHQAVLFASIRVLNEKIRGFAFSNLVDDTIMPTINDFASVNTTLPTFSFSDTISLPTLAEVTRVDFSDVPSTPSFEAPSLSLTTAPTISDLSLTPTIPTAPSILQALFDGSGLSAPTYTKPSLSLETLSEIADLSISATVPEAPAILAAMFDNSGLTAPTYTKPEITKLETLSTIPSLVLPNPPEAPSDPSFSAPTISAVSVSSIGVPPTFDETAITTYIGEMNDFIDSSEDVELAMAKAKETEIRLQNEVQDFNEGTVAYQGALQEAIKNADIASAKALKDGDFNLQTQISEYAETLKKYQSDIAKYQTQVGAEVQAFSNNLQKDIQSYNAQNQIYIAQYQADIQNELNEFNKENVAYQEMIKYKMLDAQLDSAEDAQNIQKYQAELQSYAAQVNADVQEFVSNYQKNIQVYNAQNQVALAQYQADIQNELNEFNKENAIYQAQINYKMQDAQLDAQGDSQAIQKYQTEIQAYAAEVNAEVQEYVTNEIQKEINIWNTNIKSELESYSLNIQKETSRTSADIAVFKTFIDKALQQYQVETGQDVSRYSAVASAVIAEFQQNLANAVQVFQSELEKYAAENAQVSARNNELLNKYQIESTQFATNVQKAVQEFSANLQKNSIEINVLESSYIKLKQEYEQGFIPFSNPANDRRK